MEISAQDISAWNKSTQIVDLVNIQIEIKTLWYAVKIRSSSLNTSLAFKIKTLIQMYVVTQIFIKIWIYTNNRSQLTCLQGD
jgi:hypothetical protein